MQTHRHKALTDCLINKGHVPD